MAQLTLTVDMEATPPPEEEEDTKGQDDPLSNVKIGTLLHHASSSWTTSTRPSHTIYNRRLPFSEYLQNMNHHTRTIAAF